MPTIHVELLPGRTREQKREFAEAVTREACRILHCRPEDVQVLFVVVEKEDWSVGGRLLCDPET